MVDCRIAWRIRQRFFALFCKESRRGNCEECQICNICVAPKFRRLGYASELLKAVKEFASEEGCERCELEVNVSNEPAVGLYKKCDYAVEGVRKNFYRRSRYATRDAYTMVLQLTKPNVND